MTKKAHSGLYSWLLLISVLILCFIVLEWGFRYSSLGDKLGSHGAGSVPERVRQAPAKSPNKFRILGIGDSFTIYRDSQGKNYLRIMQKLAQKEGNSVEIINLARPGTGPDYYEAVARKYVDTLKPDLVTVGLYLGDDVPAKVLPPHFLPAPDRSGFKEMVKSQSQLLRYTFRILKQHIPAIQSGHFDNALAIARKELSISDQIFAQRLRSIDPEIIDYARSDAINPWDLVKGLMQPNQYRELITQDPASASANHIDAFITMLRRFKKFTDQRKIPLIIIIFPIRIQVSIKDQSYFEKLGIKTGQDLIGDSPLQKTIAAKMKAYGFHHVDMLPALKKAKGDMYIPLDTHLNNAGQVVAGTHLYHYLKTNNILTKKYNVSPEG